MQPTSTKLHQSVELFDQLLSPLNEAGNSFFGYIKEGKTEKEKNNQKQSKRKTLLCNKLAYKVSSLQNDSRFCFCFVFIPLINSPEKMAQAFFFFLFQKSLVTITQGISTKHKKVFSFHSCWVAAELFICKGYTLQSNCRK